MTVARDHLVELILDAEDYLLFSPDATTAEVVDRIPSQALIDLLVERGDLTPSSLSRTGQAYWAAPGLRSQAARPEVTHQAPFHGTSTMPCCGAWVTEASPGDRLTNNPRLVTCPGHAVAAVATVT